MTNNYFKVVRKVTPTDHAIQKDLALSGLAHPLSVEAKGTLVEVATIFFDDKDQMSAHRSYNEACRLARKTGGRIAVWRGSQWRGVSCISEGWGGVWN